MADSVCPTSQIMTFSGGIIDPINPSQEDINIEDIAHSLANSCRWTGHVRKFYSVAQHSDMVSRYVPEEDAMWGLLHDATEAYLSDLARPIKACSGLGTIYKSVEEKLMKAIAAAFSLPWPEPPSIKVADTRALATEARDLINVNKNYKSLVLTDIKPFEERIVPWSPENAKIRFLSRYNELSGDRFLCPH